VQAPVLEIAALEPGAEAAWDAFVDAHEDGTIFHRAAWRKIIGEVYGHDCPFRLARRGRTIVGILPLVHVAGPLFGNALISTGFGVRGGILAADQESFAALAACAAKLGEERRVDYVELRHLGRSTLPWPCKDTLYVNFMKPLSRNTVALFASLPATKRAEIRKAVKAGLQVRSDRDVDTFYAIYAESLRNLGTPVYPKRFVEAVLAQFPRETEITTVYADGRPISTILSFLFKGRVNPYYGGSLPQSRALHADDLKYWSLMNRYALEGFEAFDFGRSKRATGSFAYKVNWGFEPQPMHYHYHLVRQTTLPDINPLNPKYRLMVAAWQRLPLGIANRLGPWLARQIG
jgi:FemAB-related protein (PEP-CTERM system-associated)